MKKIPRLVLRENQILAGTSMGHLVGGYELPTVYVYPCTTHPGDPYYCPECYHKMPGTDKSKSDPIQGIILTGIAYAYCNMHEGEQIEGR